MRSNRLKCWISIKFAFFITFWHSITQSGFAAAPFRLKILLQQWIDSSGYAGFFITDVVQMAMTISVTCRNSGYADQLFFYLASRSSVNLHQLAFMENFRMTLLQSGCSPWLVAEEEAKMLIAAVKILRWLLTWPIQQVLLLNRKLWLPTSSSILVDD